MQECAKELLQWLATCRARVDALEAKGKACIEAGNTPGYVESMREKAVFLEGLAAQGIPLAKKLPEPHRSEALWRLERFSRNAGQALGLQSVFYMSALLFPDNHKPGQPNDLDNFATELESALR